jgi:hypothetical protein
MVDFPIMRGEPKEGSIVSFQLKCDHTFEKSGKSVPANINLYITGRLKVYLPFDTPVPPNLLKQLKDSETLKKSS